MIQQKSLFDDQRLTLSGAIELSVASLREYGGRYRHWVVTYSGGKDSSATVTFVAWAIQSGQVERPESLTVLYADTRQEYPPLHATAMKVLAALERNGIETHVVTPPLDKRFYVYMLGYGVPPPGATFRWCTGALKIAPMTAWLDEIRRRNGEKFLLLNGVRMGESAARDQRIALSCSKNTGECGQGWFQSQPPAAAGDTLAPLLHWRLCHVYDWLYFEEYRHGYPEVAGIADVYGDDDVRTGCIACPVASRDVALERLSAVPAWDHLRPLLELRDIFNDMRRAKWRKRKADLETDAAGQPVRNIQRKGPLTMEARAYWLDRVLDIQRRVNEAAAGRTGVDLINAEEEARIREMWALDMWPRKWSADDINADVPLDRIMLAGSDLIVQPILVRPADS